MRLSFRSFSEPEGISQLCHLQIERDEQDQEVSDLIETIDSFQRCCQEGFFTDQGGAAVERYVELSVGVRGSRRRWSLSSRALKDGVERILYRLLLQYDTGRGLRLEAYVPESASATAPIFDDILKYKTKCSFPIRWDWVLPLGKIPVLRFEFNTGLTPEYQDRWFEALAAWKHIVIHQIFENTKSDNRHRIIQRQKGTSALFMLSPIWMEYASYGIAIDNQALVELLNFLNIQWYEFGLLANFEIQR